jgi:hypothetical protein
LRSFGTAVKGSAYQTAAETLAVSAVKAAETYTCAVDVNKIKGGYCMTKKKLLISIFALTLVVSAYAQQYNSESDFTFNLDKNVEGGIVITGYAGTRKEVRIPPNIQNNQVTSIGRDAFYENRNITSITIPNSVIRIGSYAFRFCSSLISINIGNSVITIGDGVFEGCTNLANINIPNSLTGIGYVAFRDCRSLTGITIPNSVTSIGYQAFYNCQKLTSVTISNRLTVIRDGTFSGCKSLTSITIPGSVTNIEFLAFKDCEKLTSVTFQGTIASDKFGGHTHIGNFYSPFDGDLRDKYLAQDDGRGTYIRSADGETWIKR